MARYPLFLVKLLIQSGLARCLPSVRRLLDGGCAFLGYYSDRLLSMPVRQLQDLGAFLDLHGPDSIDLSQGAPCFDLAPSSSTKLPANRRGWPPAGGLPELRIAVAEALRNRYQRSFNPTDEVLITLGAAHAFSTVLDTFINPGHRVVLFDPTSPMYSLALQHRRARIRWVPTWVEEGRTRFRLEPLVRAMRGARLIVLNSPANPTGGVLAAEDLEQVAWWAQRHDVLIFSDGVFERFSYENPDIHIETFSRAQKRTLTAGSVSKGHALACARVGWLAGHRHLVRPCALTALMQTPFVPTLSQQIALAALRQPEETFQPVQKEFLSRRNYTHERLQAMGLRPARPAGAFFFWIPVGDLGLNGRDFAERLLRSKKVLLTPGHSFGPSGEGFVRLSYAQDDGRLREGLGRLAEFVQELRQKQPPSFRRAA